MAFEKLLEIIARHLWVIESVEKGCKYTQLVIGEMHYLPRVQCELLRALCSLRSELTVQLFGKEGLPVKPLAIPCDYERAADDEQYMRELLIQNINAVTVFSNTHAEVRVEAVDDQRLRELSGYIDKRCYELFSQRQARCLDEVTDEEKLQYNYWFTLLKTVLLD